MKVMGSSVLHSSVRLSLSTPVDGVGVLVPRLAYLIVSKKTIFISYYVIFKILLSVTVTPS